MDNLSVQVGECRSDPEEGNQLGQEAVSLLVQAVDNQLVRVAADRWITREVSIQTL